MKYFSKFLKGIAVSIIIAVISVVFMETTSFLLLKTGVVPSGWRQQLVVDKFPSQFRLDQKTLDTVLVPSKRTKTSDLLRGRFDFDPVIGFRRLSSLRWYTNNKESSAFRKENADVWWGDFAQEARGKFLVLAFGGSTTAHAHTGNWPKHIPAIYGQNKSADIIVLNAGHDGFTTMQEQLYAAYWILPRLKALSIKPSVAITLDGVNDISFAVEGYRVWKQNQQASWYSHYSGYHQHLDLLYSNINTFSFAVRNLIGSLSTSPSGGAVLSFLAHYVPTTLSLTNLQSTKRHFGKGSSAIRAGVTFITAYKAHNIFLLRDLFTAIPHSTGSVSLLSDGTSASGAKVALSLSDTNSQKESLVCPITQSD